MYTGYSFLHLLWAEILGPKSLAGICYRGADGCTLVVANFAHPPPCAVGLKRSGGERARGDLVTGPV